MRTRMCVEFAPDSLAVLERLAEELGTTKVGVLRFGLHLIHLARRERQAGNALGFVRGERVVKEVAAPWNDVAEPIAV